MSNEPAWVDEPEPAEPVRVDERQMLIESVTILLETIKRSIVMVRQNLVKLDEVGCPVSRSKTRAEKLQLYHDDLITHYKYDVVDKRATGTKEQQRRAENYELS